MMKAQDAIRTALAGSQQIVNMYLQDLSDADLLVRPVPHANHIAWQLGHLIASERNMVSEHIPGVKYPELPAGFAERHNKETASRDTGFGTKAEYLDLYGKVRQTTIDAVGKLSDADLDKPITGPMAAMIPKVGDLLLLNANHAMMHAGQFTVVRRKLGKPVLF
jgi:DinB superfamily